MAGGELCHVAFGGIRGGFNLLEPRAIHLRCDDVREPSIGESPCSLQRAIRTTAAPDRWAAVLSWRRLHQHVGERRIEFSTVADSVAAPELAQQRDAFGQPRTALAAWHTTYFVLAWKLAA